MKEQLNFPLVPGLCTVVIPVFNRTVELHEAIRSVAYQTYRNIELIVVDDGSEPPLERIDYEDVFAGTGIPLQWITLPENQGPSSARNHGLQAASGEFITFLDSDDSMLPQKLEESIRVLRTDRNISAVMCGYRISGQVGAHHGKPHDRLPEGPVTLNRLLSFDRSLCVTGDSTYRTEIVRRVNGFDPLLHGVEDFDILMRILAHGGTVRPLRQVLLQVDVSPKRSHLSNDLSKQKIARARFLEKHSDLLARSPKAYLANILYLGIVRYRSGMFSEAADNFLRVIRLNPLKLKAWVYLLCCVAPWLYSPIVRATKMAQRRP